MSGDPTKTAHLDLDGGVMTTATQPAPATTVDVAALRTCLQHAGATAATVPGLAGRWSSMRALTDGRRHDEAVADVDVLLEHGLLRWAGGPAGHGVVWQRTPAGTRWMRAATDRLPNAPVARAAVEARAPHMSVVTVTHPSDTVSLAVVVGSGDDGLWWAHDTLSCGHAADSPGVALEDFARRAAADADARTATVRCVGGGDARLRELADEGARILRDRRRLAEHLLEHADALGEAVITAIGGVQPHHRALHGRG